MSNIDRNDFDAIFDQFLQLLANPITLFAPMRKFTSKQQKLINKTWIRRGVLKSIKTKQKCTYHILQMVTRNQNKSTKIC